MIKGAIFDVDGTLLDSMEIWEDVGVRYLNSIGIEAEPDLGTVLFTMSIQEGAAYVKEHYHLSQEPEEIVQGVLDIISNYYKKTALLKSGAKELLEKLDKHNIPMTYLPHLLPHYRQIQWQPPSNPVPLNVRNILTGSLPVKRSVRERRSRIFICGQQNISEPVRRRRLYSKMSFMQSVLQSRQGSRL